MKAKLYYTYENIREKLKCKNQGLRTHDLFVFSPKKVKMLNWKTALPPTNNIQKKGCDAFMIFVFQCITIQIDAAMLTSRLIVVEIIAIIPIPESSGTWSSAMVIVIIGK